MQIYNRNADRHTLASGNADTPIHTGKHADLKIDYLMQPIGRNTQAGMPGGRHT